MKFPEINAGTIKIAAKAIQNTILQETTAHFNHVPLFVCICILYQERHKLGAVDYPDLSGQTGFFRK